MYKNIMLCLDGGSHDAAVVKAGIYLGQELSAKLHALTIQDISTLEGPLMYDLSGALAFIPQMDPQEQ